MDEIRDARRAAGLTQAQLAGLVGISRANVAGYESGSRPLSVAMRNRLLRATRRPSRVLAEHAEEVKERLARDHMTNVRVFGSVARGEDTPASDVDLLVDVVPGVTAFDLAGARLDLMEMLGLGVDLVTSRSVPPHRSDILDEAVPL